MMTLVHVVFSEKAWCAACPGCKLTAEALHVLVSDAIGDLFDGLVASCEHIHGLLLFKHHEIFTWGYAEGLTENAMAMSAAYTEPVRNILQPISC
ncbi:hypothetical protein D3C73_776050 [compost metagenome]